MKKGNILIVDDNKNVLSALRILLSDYFENIVLLTSPNTLMSELRDKNPDVVLLDMNFSAGINSGNEGLFWLSEIKKADEELPVVLFTAYADIDLAVKALKEEDICWGKSPAMQRLLTMIKKVAVTDANVLITGENGTGKELIAKMIHRYSPRAAETLIIVDMGAVTETLFESELFGHVKGAFTDAKADRSGKFEAADGGSLFLDEIGNLSYPLQAKLLSALQTRHITRVGSNKSISVDIRLISATNKNLFKSVKKGEFREDLLYRINTIHLEVPPLRERREDIPQLADFFLRRLARKYGKSDLKLGEKALCKLESYAWPGNVRELEHAIEKAVILSDNQELQPNDFYMRTPDETSFVVESFTLEEMEKILIEKALRKYDNNISAVAAELGISRPTLYSKIRKYEL